MAAVLVTGATGYIATHVIQQLQQKGYKVKGTVRSLNNKAKIDPLWKLCPEAKHKLELVEIDLLDPKEKWIEVIQGCEYVLHMAATVITDYETTEEDAIVKPAVEGTANILQACKSCPSVKRVVYTSSTAAVSGPYLGGHFTDENWTDLTRSDLSPYVRGKALAERAAWDFVRDVKTFEFCTICPCVVLGPILCGFLSETPKLIKRFFDGDFDPVPPLDFTIVDIRDVAEIHVQALTAPEIVNKRVIASNHYIRFQNMAKILKAEFSDLGYNISTEEATDEYIKGNEVLMRQIARNGPTTYDQTLMLQLLGHKPREIPDMIISTAHDLIRKGFIKKTDLYNERYG